MEVAMHQERLTLAQKKRAWHLRGMKLSPRDIARELGIAPRLLTVVAKRRPSARPLVWSPRPGRLSADERELILVGLGRGDSMSLIARQLGRAASTVTREVKANGGAGGYGGGRAPVRAQQCTRRPKPFKL